MDEAASRPCLTLLATVLLAMWTNNMHLFGMVILHDARVHEHLVVYGPDYPEIVIEVHDCCIHRGGPCSPQLLKDLPHRHSNAIEKRREHAVIDPGVLDCYLTVCAVSYTCIEPLFVAAVRKTGAGGRHIAAEAPIFFVSAHL